MRLQNDIDKKVSIGARIFVEAAEGLICAAVLCAAVLSIQRRRKKYSSCAEPFRSNGGISVCVG